MRISEKACGFMNAASQRSLVVLLAVTLISSGLASAFAQAPADTTQAATPAVPSVAAPEPSSAASSVPGSSSTVARSSSKTLPHDLSPWGMFKAADMVVQAVMMGLAFASVVTWTVWLVKSIELARAKRRLRRGIALILAADNLNTAVRTFDTIDGTSAVLVREAADEARISAPAFDHTDSNGVKERVTSRLSRVEADASRRMMTGTGLLATIGATAPFVGLFGTVWGIMNSFIGISQAQTTNLAVVAPGIAEALLATALGLVAAIPAVIIYNVFARSIADYRKLLADASAGIERLVSRELDLRHVPTRTVALSRAAE